MSMKATPQQVQGGSLYSHKTRLGNWAEEIAINDAKLDNFRQRSETGALSLRKQEIKLERCNEIVPHSYSEDGLVRFGDVILPDPDEVSAQTDDSKVKWLKSTFSKRRRYNLP